MNELKFYSTWYMSLSCIGYASSALSCSTCNIWLFIEKWQCTGKKLRRKTVFIVPYTRSPHSSTKATGFDKSLALTVTPFKPQSSDVKIPLEQECVHLWPIHFSSLILLLRWWRYVIIRQKGEKALSPQRDSTRGTVNPCSVLNQHNH